MHNEQAGVGEVVYRVCQASKAYGGRKVLQVNTLEIYRGEIFALVGPSGAGKSTLLRLLNFLEPPDLGQVIFHDTVFSADRDMPLEQRRKVTMVFQRPMLLDRSVQANVQFGLDLRSTRDEGQVQAALEEVGLSGLSHQRARTLSGGEAQRVALARAIVLRPEVLLLDEPTANLDPYNVGLIEKIIQNLNAAHQSTLVLVTHNVFQARRLADRVGFMLDGGMIETAGTEQFFNHPADPRTAAFARGEMVY